MNNIYELEKTNSSDSSREKTIIRTHLRCGKFIDHHCRHKACR